MPLPKWELARGGDADCASCGSTNSVLLFPAALHQSAAAHAEAALAGDAACFDHPGKRAVAACGQCGRFMCQLCAVDMGAGMWCPSCVADPKGGAKRGKAESSRALYDTWALFIPFGLLLIWPLTILSAPTVVGLALLRWRRPISLVRRNRWRFVAGLAVALIQGGLWVWFIWYLVAKGPPAA
jgi:hypothetical protein